MLRLLQETADPRNNLPLLTSKHHHKSVPLSKWQNSAKYVNCSTTFSCCLPKLVHFLSLYLLQFPTIYQTRSEHWLTAFRLNIPFSVMNAVTFTNRSSFLLPVIILLVYCLLLHYEYSKVREEFLTFTAHFIYIIACQFVPLGQ